VVERAAAFLREGNNQYPPLAGLLSLREAIARHEERCYGLARDPRTEVVVTSGATEALAASLLALVQPGDEVIVFEPLYDSYVPMILRAGGVPVPIRLHAPEFSLDAGELGRKLSDKTRVILVNDPQNPAGKAWMEAELQAVASAALDVDAIVLCDEVYEHLVFDGRRHTPIAALPEMGPRDLEGRLGREGLLDDRLEGRLGHRARRALLGRREGSPVPHVHDAAEPPGGASRGASITRAGGSTS
jgi:N-succinyldiaminopimelate aminotransferase